VLGVLLGVLIFLSLKINTQRSTQKSVTKTSSIVLWLSIFSILGLWRRVCIGCWVLGVLLGVLGVGCGNRYGVYIRSYVL
jgi:hypothetical protein